MTNETEGPKSQHPGLLIEAAARSGPGHARRAARAGCSAAACAGDQAAFHIREVGPPRVVRLGQAPQSFLFGSRVAFGLFGGMAAFFGVATTTILRRLAAPDGSAPHYGTTPIAR